MRDTNTPLFSLLKEKSELKRQIKIVKQRIDSQKNQIEIQTERAKNGLTNTLAFEQTELPKFLSELLNLEKQLEDLKIDINKTETQSNKTSQQSDKTTSELVPHNTNDKDEDGFPINALGSQICLLDGNGNIFIPLHSNFFITIQENAGIKFSPKDKLEVNFAVDTLVNILTRDFYKKLEGYSTLDLTDEYKKANNVRTKEPLKILHVQMYFDWINKWLKYFGNVFNFEFKLLFYSKYKEKIKNDILSLETGLKEINAPKSHIDFTKRWIEETEKNIELETKAKERRVEATKQIHDENANNGHQTNIIIKNDHLINLIDLSNHITKKEDCPEFDRFLMHFQENKYLIINTDYKIYSPGISYLFSTKNIKAKNLEIKEDFLLDSKPYFETFINAFKEGEKYFQDKFEVSKEILYGNNSKTFVADIHQNYYHITHSNSFIGWAGVIHSNPTLISHKIIKKYGYYSGILSRADVFISEYPNVFSDFHKCDDKEESINQPTISKPTREEDIQTIKEILKPLSGYWKRNLILNQNDFSNLIEYSLHIMKNNCLPNKTKQFPNTGTSIEFIRKTIHLVYLHLGKKNKPCFVSLIHLFKQLDKTDEKTTNSKFSAYTGNYEADVQTMITY
ncbi:hypothetical protein [Flavobacterium microcysteis]|uniref:Uncharacterized protein n=1 Tax=Flavobacterium microcysteis TaxID=2596891 RepID=A0A501Q4N7_9FLAO|nr:hypothetical protein [Flavobacterium microcysteis]TPD67322.1 hypothetical protein FJA49_13705 [Flavobacterium microcysteis]